MMSSKQKIETNDAPKAIGPYSQGVSVLPFIFTSGQLGINPKTGQLAGSEIRIQVIYALDNIESILKAAAVGFEDVVRCDVFFEELG